MLLLFFKMPKVWHNFFFLLCQHQLVLFWGCFFNPFFKKQFCFYQNFIKCWNLTLKKNEVRSGIHTFCFGGVFSCFLSLFGLEFPFWGQVTYFIGNSVYNFKEDTLSDIDNTKWEQRLWNYNENYFKISYYS